MIEIVTAGDISTEVQKIVSILRNIAVDEGWYDSMLEAKIKEAGLVRFVKHDDYEALRKEHEALKLLTVGGAGWQLVPVNPDHRMRLAHGSTNEQDARDDWRRMLQAAPKPNWKDLTK